VTITADALMGATPGSLITGDGQVEWNGMLFGDGVLTYISGDSGEGIAGWEDLPGQDSGDVAKTADHGYWPGDSYASERVVTWVGHWRPPAAGSDDGSALRALRSATTINGTPQPLIVRLLGETLMAYGKVTSRVLPSDGPYGVRAGKLSIEWTCADPRRYSMNVESAAIAIPVDTPSGLTYPLVYPLNYGTAYAPPTATVTNAMDANAPVKMTWTGPMTNPIMVNLTTGAWLGFAVDLALGDTFAIDTSAQTVTLNGVDRRFTRMPGSTPLAAFTLAEGDNDIEMRASAWSPGNEALITFRSTTF